jgi:hypothetical protein
LIPSFFHFSFPLLDPYINNNLVMKRTEIVSNLLTFYAINHFGQKIRKSQTIEKAHSLILCFIPFAYQSSFDNFYLLSDIICSLFDRLNYVCVSEAQNFACFLSIQINSSPGEKYLDIDRSKTLSDRVNRSC